MAWDPQLEFVAAMNGMTPEQYLRTQQADQLATPYDDPSLLGDPAFRSAVQADIDAQMAQYPDGVFPNQAAYEQARKAATDRQIAKSPKYQGISDGTVDAQITNTSLATQAQAGRAAITDPLKAGYAQDAQTRASNVTNLGAAFNNATAGNAGLLGDLRSATSAADARDQQLLGAYGSAVNQANGIDSAAVSGLEGLYGGMRQLQASGYVGDAASDPSLVGAQRSVYDTFGDYAAGAGDITSQAALAEADPEALAAQKDVLGKLRERSDPRITDAERAVFMEARLQREQADRANRDANMSELARRGMSGSTMALSNLNASSQEAGNTRALADTKASGQAIQRAEAALRDYGTMGSTIAGQSFDRSFRTGQAADTVAAGNVDRRLGATANQGTMATSMRNADDALRTFNKSQQQQQAQFADNYRATQQQQAWTRGTDLASAQMTRGTNLAGRAQGVANTGLTASNNAASRAQGVATTGQSMNRDYLTGYDQVVGRSNEATRDNAADRRGAASLDLAGLEMDLGAQQRSADIAQQGRTNVREGARADAAIARTEEQARLDRKAQEDAAASGQLFGLRGLVTDIFS